LTKKPKHYKNLTYFLKKLNDDLKKQDIIQKEFIDIAVHELRTPVQSIIGYLTMVKSFPESYSSYHTLPYGFHNK